MQPYLYQNRGGRTEGDRVNVSGHPCRVELLNGDRGGGEEGGGIGKGGGSCRAGRCQRYAGTKMPGQ